MTASAQALCIACFQAADWADTEVRTTNCGGPAGWAAGSAGATAMVDCGWCAFRPNAATTRPGPSRRANGYR